MHLGHVERAIKMWALPSGMPSGAGGELAFFDEHNISPALKGEVIEQPNPHDATANNNYTGMGFHFGRS
jgi:hypothetical protein